MSNDEKVELIDDEIITLYDDKDNPVQFHEVARVEYEDEYYALLQPVETMEGLGEDEALIFKLVEQEGEDADLFVPVEDEAVLEAVFEEYLRAAADCECDCNCEDGCGDDCDCEHHHCDCDDCKHEA